YFSKRNFRSILYNLISNAIKYANVANECKVRITTRTTDKYFELAVQDNGLGIADKNLKNIFKMFKRYHDHVEGTGVGLYIVKRIIDNAKGEIEVISKEREGTRFVVKLPNDVL